MTKYFFIFLILSSIQKVFSQNTFKTIIKDSSTNETLIGARASIKGTNNGALANEKGEIILSNILNGKQIIRFSYEGYKTVQQEFDFPLRQQIEVVFLSSNTENLLDEVIVQGTRSNRSIAKIPTRVEDYRKSDFRI